MPKREALFAGAVAILLLSACGGRDPTPGQGNDAATAAGQVENMSQPGPAEPPANDSADPVPPPDAVSHPGGYLPPAPAEPDPPVANSSAPDAPGPATEDDYLRNRQSGR